jgi:hypothetical protein
MNPKANVTRDIVDLVPQFLRSRELEVESLKIALGTADQARLRVLGQRMRAVGAPYGFPEISTLGRQIMDACAGGDLEAIHALVTEYADYLRTVEVVPVEVPPETWRERPIVTPIVTPSADEL